MNGEEGIGIRLIRFTDDKKMIELDLPEASHVESHIMAQHFFIRYVLLDCGRCDQIHKYYNKYIIPMGGESMETISGAEDASPVKP